MDDVTMRGQAGLSRGTQGMRRLVEDLFTSHIGIVSQYGRGRPGIIPLWFGEGNVPTADFICDAARQAMRDGYVFYSDNRGQPDLRNALSSYLERLYQVPVSVGRITITSSGMSAIQMVMQCLIDPGDEVVIAAPVWPNVFAAVEIMGGCPVEVPLLLNQEGWRLDPEHIFSACGPRTRAIFLNSPGNPTGWVMSREDMRLILDFARARGIWIISDEVYGRLVYDAEVAPSFLEICEADDRVLVVNSFSKAWCMTGWRVGWIVAPEALGSTFVKVIQYTNSGTAPFLQLAGKIAIEQGEGLVRELRARCQSGRQVVEQALMPLERVQLAPIRGAFYAFFKVAGMQDSLSFAKTLIDQANVGLAPGSAFGSAGEGFLRLCFASTGPALEEAMGRLVRVLAG